MNNLTRNSVGAIIGSLANLAEFTAYRASMLPLRRSLAVLLVASLLVSDALTFWHMGKCACEANCDVVGQCDATGESEPLACGSSCEHATNPFAKRRIARDENDSLLAASSTGNAASQSCDLANSSESPSHHHDSEEHDPGDCSLCRWLATTRSGWSYQLQPLLIELSPLETSPVLAWSNPVTEHLLHELSRRGPPQPLSLS
jgi:hypothetical protein